MSRRRPFALLVIAASITASIAASCGVTVDQNVRDINPRDVPGGLMATSTTSTTTTTTSTTSTTVLAPPTVEPTSTLPLPPTTKRVILYFVVDDRFVEEFREVPVDGNLQSVVNELAEGPQGPETTVFATTSVQFDDVVSVRLNRGVATVELSDRIAEMSFAERLRLAGQLVLTLTSQSNVGQVQFTVAGQPFEVPQGDGTFSDGSLARESFVDLVTAIEPVVSSTIPLDGPIDGPIDGSATSGGANGTTSTIPTTN
jgi:hypothetical protein